MEDITGVKKNPATLCWDCANATGGCPWSKRLRPVKGWKAIHTKKMLYGGIHDSYIVLECPLFERDAVGSGLRRYKEEKVSEPQKDDIEIYFARVFGHSSADRQRNISDQRKR